MTAAARPRPLKEAGRITKMLDLVLGEDRFDRAPVDVEQLALEYSRQTAPEGPIHEVMDKNIPGCMGALLYSEEQPRQWGIVCHVGQSKGKRAFTIGHELGHFVLHRQMIEADPAFDGGIYCDENSVERRSGTGIEQEADEFAAALLMPLHDFRRMLPAKSRPDFEVLGQLAARYGVSLTAAVLRWVEYTDRRAVMVVSNEGFALWSRPSLPALRTNRFIKTKDTLFTLPGQAAAARAEYTDEARAGIAHPAGVWFPEPVVEMCLRSDRYDQEITILHLEEVGPRWQGEDTEEDTFDRFVRSGQG